MINIIGLLKLIPGNYCRKFRLDPSWDGRGNMIAPWAPTGSALETKKENVQKRLTLRHVPMEYRKWSSLRKWIHPCKQECEINKKNWNLSSFSFFLLFSLYLLFPFLLLSLLSFPLFSFFGSLGGAIHLSPPPWIRPWYRPTNLYGIKSQVDTQ